MSIVPKSKDLQLLGTFVILDSGVSTTNNDFVRVGGSSSINRMINATDKHFNIQKYEFIYDSEGSFSIALRIRQSISSSLSTMDGYTITSSAQSIVLESSGYTIKKGTTTGSDFLVADATITGVANSELFLSIWGTQD